MDPIRVEGLRELQAALKAADGESQKRIRVVLNDAATIIIEAARPKQPRRKGTLAGTLKARSGQREAVVQLGGSRAPYAGFIEFGGRVGPKKSVSRPFVRAGRTLYPQLARRRDDIIEVMDAGLEAIARDAGLGVS